MLSNSFKWKHFVGEIILLNVRWYLKYPLSYRNLKEMMIERGIQVDHSTIMRWVHQYSPEIEKKIRRHLRPTNDSWRVDETYIDRVVKVANFQPLRKFQRKIFPFQKILHLLKGSSS